MRTANYRPIKRKEADEATVEVIVPFIEMKYSQDFYCTLIKLDVNDVDTEVYCQSVQDNGEEIQIFQGEATSNTVTQELGNNAIKEA